MFDVAIIGAGTAGLAALREVGKRTENYILINDGPYGTTCARVGCMPSKLLIEAANAFHRRHAFDAFGIRGAERLSADIPAVLRRVRTLRDDFVGGVLQATDDLGARSIAARARLLGPGLIAAGGREIRARKIVVATGSRPVVPKAWRGLGGLVLTTDDLFEQETLPARMAVVGMGPIGVELAQAMSRLGVRIHAFETGERIAGLSDPVVSDAFVSSLRREFPLHLGAPAELRAEGDGVRVSNGEADVVVDRVLAALGRRPNVDDIGLETLGCELDEDGMPSVDPHTMRVAEVPVFLVGDANGSVPLLHEAVDEGYIAGRNAAGDGFGRYRRRTPLAVVFAEPNVAVVGKSWGELDASETAVGRVGFERQGRARAAQRDEGAIGVYAEKQTGLLLGAEMCAPAGEHMAHLLALAIGRSLTVHDLLRMPFYHPVLEEGLRTALRDLAAQIPAGHASDLAGCDAFGVDALD